jgi:hypothetical protein
MHTIICQSNYQFKKRPVSRAHQGAKAAQNAGPPQVQSRHTWHCTGQGLQSHTSAKETPSNRQSGGKTSYAVASDWLATWPAGPSGPNPTGDHVTCLYHCVPSKLLCAPYHSMRSGHHCCSTQSRQAHTGGSEACGPCQSRCSTGQLGTANAGQGGCESGHALPPRCCLLPGTPVITDC